jgi:2'-5' RNA ligase
VRLFLACKPDRAAEAQIGRRLMEAQEAAGDVARLLRWTPASNVHVTLHFLGEVAGPRVDRLVETLGRTINEEPFEITLGATGTFPATGAPRVVWLDVVNGVEPLGRLHTELARRVSTAGVTVEPRPLSPHVTMARVPDRERAHVKLLRERLASLEAAPITWVADRVILFRSDLSGSVPRYEGMQDIELSRGPSGIGTLNAD